MEIAEHDEMLGDHYDPRHKRLVLSLANCHGTLLAALGEAAHEAGHALQHKAAYAPLHLHLRMAVVGVTNFASQRRLLSANSPLSRNVPGPRSRNATMAPGSSTR